MEVHIIDIYSDFLALKEYVEEQKYEHFVLDTETDNKIERIANLWGIGFCFSDHEAFYIPIRKLDTSKQWMENEEKDIADWILSQAKTKKLIGHNIIYDVLVLQKNWNYDLTSYIYSDTILQKHLIDEERPFGLKEVAVKYLGSWADKAQKDLYDNIEKNGGKTNKDSIEMFKADTAILGEYCGYDTLLTKKLFDIFENRLKEEKLFDLFYKDEIMPLYKEVTIPMKKRGFNVDVKHFQDLLEKINKDINSLHNSIMKELVDVVSEFEEKLLNENYPAKPTPKFVKKAAELLNIPLPKKDDKITLSKPLIKKLTPSTDLERSFYSWVLKETEIFPADAVQIQRALFFEDNPEETCIFNINSNNHLKWLFFTNLGEEPKSRTDKGEPQVDDDFFESVKDLYEWVNLLIDYKKLSKLKSTYIQGILDQQIDGIVYSTYIQFGPPSGRFASKNPNLQNLPRVKEDDAGLSPLVLEYTNAIKRGFIAPDKYLILNSDFSSLEPCAFSEACGDKKLQNVFIKKYDLYSSIAIDVWNLKDASADKKAENYLKNKYPEYRQKAKVIALAVVYGAEAGRIAGLLNIPYQEAQEIIDNYLDSYPGLKSYMENCEKSACFYGQVKTKFGRIRRLPEAKRLYKTFGLRLLNKKWAKENGVEELRWKFKNMLNLAKNFPIQGIAAHIVNRASVAISRKFKEAGIDGQIVAQVHDEITCIVKEEHVEQAKAIMKDCMENTTKIAVPLIAEPLIAKTWDEAK